MDSIDRGDSVHHRIVSDYVSRGKASGTARQVCVSSRIAGVLVEMTEQNESKAYFTECAIQNARSHQWAKFMYWSSGTAQYFVEVWRTGEIEYTKA